MIEALMMVMTLCLLVYNVAQYTLRLALKEQNETLPNQLGKEVKNPTMRWIFQIMEGIGIVRFYDGAGKKLMKEVITNLNDLRKKIIRLLGDVACRMYRLIPESRVEILGMQGDLLAFEWEKTNWTFAQANQVIRRIDSILEQLPAGMKQAHDRIIGERVISSEDKILSLYDKDAQVIVRGKAGNEVEWCVLTHNLWVISRKAIADERQFQLKKAA